jgi:hypothetical protein
MINQAERHLGKELIQFLRINRMDGFGAEIKADALRAVIGIEMPSVGTKKQFDSIALQELSAVDYARSILLNEGKYLTMRDGDYRILLPSENARQVESYMQQADKKLRRALKLTKNTPRSDNQTPNNTAARILMKRESINQKINLS